MSEMQVLPNRFVLLNTKTRRVHTGYFSGVAPKIYIRDSDAKGARTRMRNKEDWEIWRVEGFNFLNKINPNPIRKRYR